MSAIEVVELTKDYGDVRANDDISFNVESGEIFGYLGPNGAGKTTTIKQLLGLLSPTSGTAKILGADIHNEKALVDKKESIGYLPDLLGFDEEVTGQKVLDYFASIRSDERREELLESFDPPLDRPIREYSRGNRRMLGLIQTLMHNPDLVIMDEPTVGLDPLKKDLLHKLLESERDRGTTVFFSSHVLSEVQRICDRVGILRDGDLVTIEDVNSLIKRGGKRVRTRLSKDLDLSDFVTDDMLNVEKVGNAAQFTYTGKVKDLLTYLDELDVEDVNITDPQLAEIFKHYYNDSKTKSANKSGGDR
ncbi:ABC transporter [archaeon SCG-AAA382B04]|nr:ABC transporter [archaeon SCG-AAA382B04]